MKYINWYKSTLSGAALLVSAAALAAPANATVVADEVDLLVTNSGGLAPLNAPIVQAVTIVNNNNMYNAIADHLADPTFGAASGDILNGVTVWGDAYASKADLESRSGVEGFDAYAKGGMVGLDKELTDSIKVGLGFQYAQTDADASLRTLNIKTKGGFGYAEYAAGDWFVNAVASYGHSDYSERGHGNNAYIARYDADVYAFQAMTGYHFEDSFAVITPQGGFRYAVIKREAYYDTAGQNVKKSDMDILTAVAGINIKSRACGGLIPEAHATITYDLVSDTDNAFVYALDGSSYRVNGERLHRFGAELGVGVSYDLGNWNLGIGYDFGIRDDFTSHSGMLKAKYSF